MDKRCLLLVCKDTLFRQVVLGLLLDIHENVEMFESAARTIHDLLNEVSDIDPDIILLEETSPLSEEFRLVHMLLAKPGRPVIVISQEHNWMHVVHCETVQLSSANDLINAINFI